MNSAVIQVGLSVLEEAVAIIPQTSAAAPLVTAVINALENWVPLVVGEFKVLVPVVKNIIASLQSSGAVTADQKATLTQLDAQTDAAFEAATQGLDPDAA